MRSRKRWTLSVNPDVSLTACKEEEEEEKEEEESILVVKGRCIE